MQLINLGKSLWMPVDQILQIYCNQKEGLVNDFPTLKNEFEGTAASQIVYSICIKMNDSNQPYEFLFGNSKKRDVIYKKILHMISSGQPMIDYEALSVGYDRSMAENK